MNNGVNQVYIQTSVTKIRESFDFLKFEFEIINGSFKMIGRLLITGSPGSRAERNQPIIHKEDYHG